MVRVFIYLGGLFWLFASPLVGEVRSVSRLVL